MIQLRIILETWFLLHGISCHEPSHVLLRLCLSELRNTASENNILECIYIFKFKFLNEPTTVIVNVPTNNQFRFSYSFRFHRKSSASNKWHTTTVLATIAGIRSYRYIRQVMCRTYYCFDCKHLTCGSGDLVRFLGQSNGVLGAGDVFIWLATECKHQRSDMASGTARLDKSVTISNFCWTCYSLDKQAVGSRVSFT